MSLSFQNSKQGVSCFLGHFISSFETWSMVVGHHWVSNVGNSFLSPPLNGSVNSHLEDAFGPFALDKPVAVTDRLHNDVVDNDHDDDDQGYDCSIDTMFANLGIKTGEPGIGELVRAVFCRQSTKNAIKLSTLTNDHSSESYLQNVHDDLDWEQDAVDPCVFAILAT
jgi:hypothetical protein